MTVLMSCHVLACVWWVLARRSEDVTQASSVDLTTVSGSLETIFRTHCLCLVNVMQWAFGDFSLNSALLKYSTELLAYACFLVLVGKFTFAYVFSTIYRLLLRVTVVEDVN